MKDIVISQAPINLPDAEPVVAYADISDEEWLRLRERGIGGSDAGAAMDLSKYASPLMLCLKKTGRLALDDISGEEAVKMGNILEPLIREHIVAPYLDEKLGIAAEVMNPTHMYRNKANHFMLANLDGFLCFEDCRQVGLEIKTGSSYVLHEWGGRDGDEVPDAYYAQVQHYMAVTGLDEWYLFGLIGNQRLLRIIPRNDAFITRLIHTERDLWEIIKRNDPLLFPLPNGSDADMNAILAIGSPQDELSSEIESKSSIKPEGKRSR